MDIPFFLHFDVNIFAALPLTIVLVAMHVRRDNSNYTARLFRTLLLVNAAMLVLEVLSWSFNGRPGGLNRGLNYASNWIFVWLSPLIISVWASYIDYHVHGSRERLRRRWYYAHPMIVSTALLVLNFFEPLVFTIDAGNLYTRKPLLWANLGASYLTHLYVLVMAMRNRYRIRGRLVTIILLFTLLPAVGAFFQVLYYGLLTIWPLMAIVLMLTYVFVESYNASMDYLTGLFNRLRADEYVHGLMDAGTPFGIAVIDLDDFKTINDTYGHHEGDAALISFADLLAEEFAGQRMIVRFGGDEFVVVTGSTDTDALRGMEERLQERVAGLNEISEKPFKLSFSFGFAVFHPDRIRSYEELFIEADQRMYAEKRENKRLRRRAGDPAGP